ncbi:MAG: peptide deformylase [Pirellulales bacterium]|nr:peptide deformylase [Pirellulales bacterium]
MSLQVIHYPHPVLRHRSKPIKKVDAELRRLVAEMFNLMYEHEGVGLAANQVGLPYRLFVANPQADRDSEETEQVFINPVIRSGKGLAEAEEGCLSIPGVHAHVLRKDTVQIQAYDLAGNELNLDLDELPARIAQHEIDHLDGVLFIDRLAPAQLAEVRDQLTDFEFEFRSKSETGEIPPEAQIAAQLEELERLRT